MSEIYIKIDLPELPLLNIEPKHLYRTIMSHFMANLIVGNIGIYTFFTFVLCRLILVHGSSKDLLNKPSNKNKLLYVDSMFNIFAAIICINFGWNWMYLFTFVLLYTVETTNLHLFDSISIGFASITLVYLLGYFV